MSPIDPELMDAFVTGRLAVEDRLLLEAQIREDPELAAEVDFHRSVVAGLVHHFDQDLIREMDRSLEEVGFFLGAEEIDLFLEGRLDAAIARKLEQRLERDNAFREQFELHELTRKGIEAQGDADLKAVIGGIDQELSREGFFKTKAGPGTAPKRARRLPLRQIAATAAGVGVLLIAAWWFWNSGRSGTDLFADYFMAYPDELSPQLEGAGFARKDSYNLLGSGMSAYRAGDYPSAAELIGQYREAAGQGDEFYSAATFYLAVCRMAAGQPSSAIPLLEGLANADNGRQAEVKWYLALALIHNDQTDRATGLLQQLSNTKYGEAAGELLEALPGK